MPLIFDKIGDNTKCDLAHEIINKAEFNCDQPCKGVQEVLDWFRGNWGYVLAITKSNVDFVLRFLGGFDDEKCDQKSKCRERLYEMLDELKLLHHNEDKQKYH